ncbi:MAG: aldehyde dehydrogenase family protein [Gemmatimonadaceae bacterium]|nr:aldehyde dehydrogenase family protein [Gemmatimonadaceae bacterium]
MGTETSPSDGLAGDGLAGEVSRTVAAARAAQPAWQALGTDARAAIVERFRQRLFERRQEVAALISRENGKPVPEATMAEVATSLDLARFYARLAPSHLAPRHLTSSTLALWRKRITISHVPYGVVAVIAPWNYPFMLPAGVVIPALVAGNAVILKPSELTPACAVLLGELLHEAGVPPGAMQVLPGDGAVGAALVSADVDKVFFTGSVATGRRVAVACAERFIPCALELGGSDPAIVCDDADVEHAASGLTWGRFANAGQTCVAPKRVFVAASIHDRFVAALQQRVGALLPRSAGGGTYDVGALIQHSQESVLASQRDDATARGARAWRAWGEGRPGHQASGGVFPPTLLLDVPPAARALHEETFGPLLPIVAVRDDEEAIALANASPFGLSASVWSRNRGRAQRIASRLQAGTVVINDVTLIAGVAEVPHGGMKASGSGRAHGVLGLEECVRTQTVVDDLFTGWRQPWWFGYGDDTAARGDAYLRLAHGRSILQRLSGVARVLKLIFKPERPV